MHKPTRISGYTEKRIDNVLINIHRIESSVIGPHISNHTSQLISVSL